MFDDTKVIWELGFHWIHESHMIKMFLEKNPSPNKSSGYNNKSSDGEAPVLEL